MGLFSKKKDKKAEEVKLEATNEKKTAAKAEAPSAKKTVAEKPKAAPKADVKKPAPKAEAKKEAPKAEAKPAAKTEAAPKKKAPTSIEKKGNVTIIRPASKLEEKPKTSAKAAPKAEPAKAEEKKKDNAGFAGKFEIKKAKDGRFVFNLYAANSVIVATSQIYSSSSSAMNGINSVIENAEKAPIEDRTLKTVTAQKCPKWEIYLDNGGQYRFRLYAPNGSCICHSQGYTSKASCKNGIESIIRTAKVAAVDKAYIKKTES